MFQHESVPAENPPVSERRITPDELKRAVTALEERRHPEEQEQEVEARFIAQTVSVEQAVESLYLGVTSDELWEEVEKQREARLQEDPQPVISLFDPPKTTFPSEVQVFGPLILASVLIIAAFIALVAFFSAH